MPHQYSLPPEAYTIFADQQGITAEIAKGAIEMCDAHRFTLIRDAFPHNIFDTLVTGVDQYIELAGKVEDASIANLNRSTKLSVYANTTVDASEEVHPLRGLLMGELIMPLCTAANSLERSRMNMGTDVEIRAFHGNICEDGGRVGMHWDDETGVAAVIGVHGIGSARLAFLNQFSIQRPLATFDIRPNDVLLMPAQNNGYGGMYDQALHEVTNVTPNNGSRTSLAMSFVPRPTM